MYRTLHDHEFDLAQDYLMSGNTLYYFCLMEGINKNRAGQHRSLELMDYETLFHHDGIVFFPENILPLNRPIYVRQFLDPYYHTSQEMDNYLKQWRAYCLARFSKMQEAWNGEAALRLHEALCSWGKRWNLSRGWSHWSFDHALQTLNRWCRSPIELDWVYQLRGIRVEGLDPQTSFEFSYLPCDLESDTWSSYERKLDEAFDATKLEYRNRVQALAAEERLAVNKYKKDHYEWLVRFQLENWSKNKIAKHFHVERKTVREGLTSTANLIGITLRKTSDPVEIRSIAASFASLATRETT